MFSLIRNKIWRMPMLLCFFWAFPLFAETTGLDVAGFEVRKYEIIGNTLLSENDLAPLFTNALGPAVTLNQVFKVLAGVHNLYLQHGFNGIAVTIPEQEIAAGVVTIKVVETAAARAKFAASTVPAKPPTIPAFEVREYEIAGNTVLSPEVIKPILAGATGKDVTLDKIKKAMGELQLAYRERGFVTVSVSLPPQQLSNAIVKVNVTEGTLAVYKVTGNRYFSSNNVVHSLPSLQTNVLLNGAVFQRELNLANANRDRRIYPVISPGPDPGTSVLELKVKDRLPFHASFDLDNDATPLTPELRLNFAAEYDNLWQLEHQMGLFYGFSPEGFKSSEGLADYFFNRPLIAYYGAYYKFPFSSPQSVQGQMNDSRDFGYDEASHQVRLPPVGDRPDFTIYANAASGETGVQYGPTTLVSSTPLQTIQSQDSGQNLTINQTLGARFNIPLALTENLHLNFSAGADVKRYALTSFNTNNFFITTVFTNSQGSQTTNSTVSSAQPLRNLEVGYLPLTLGGNFSEKDRTGNTSGGLNGSYNFAGSSTDFSQASYSPKGRATFTKFNLSISREQLVYRDWSLLVHASAQYSPDVLINNEQFAAGGINSVRGYYEGETYGDSGWTAGIEARTPYFQTLIASLDGSVPAWFRGSVFTDFGQIFLNDSNAGLKSTESLFGTGFALSANLNNHLEMRLAVGWPLINTPYSREGSVHANFSIGGQF